MMKTKLAGNGPSLLHFPPSNCLIRFTLHETIIVQGIIDMLVQTPKGLLIIDFKTDKITASEVPQRADFYRRQLDLYGRAAAAILKQKLIAKWIYFLTPAKEFQIK